MRILELEIEGFGPFRDRQVLDFERAASGGILLITGRTGAGKSSILDAISFALYGSVPRYDGKVGRVRSDHLAPDRGASVRLDFEMAGERFRVTRSPEWERPKLRGEGTTVQKPEAELWRWNTALGDWEGLAARPVDVAALLAPVLGLSHEQFLQVVLLAQGGFQRFLRAGDQERQATLRTLFRTERFAEVERLLADRRRALGDEVDLAEARILGLLEQLEAELAGDREPESAADPSVDPDSGMTDTAAASQGNVPVGGAVGLAHRRDALATALAESSSRLAKLSETTRIARARFDRADQEFRRIAALAEAQARREAAVVKESELAGRAPEMAELRATLARAEQAASIARPLSQLAEAENARALAHANHESAIQSLQHTLDAQPDLPARESLGDAAPEAALRDLRDRASATLGLLDRARDAERQLAAERSTLDQHLREVEELDIACTHLELRATELPRELASVRDEHSRVARIAESTSERRSDLDRAVTSATAAARVEALAPQIADTQRRTADAAAAVTSASAFVSELLARRLAGMAGELAAELSDGSPCAVCGAVEHPDPAVQNDPVGESEITDAEQKAEAARTRFESARDAERALGEARASAVAAAGGATHDEALATLDETERRLAEATAAELELTALSARIETLGREIENAADALAAQQQHRATLRGAIASAEQRLGALSRQLERDRAGYVSVGERLDATTALRTRSESALAGLLALNTATQRESQAVRELDEAVAAAGFASAAEAHEAARSAEERERVEALIEAHVSEQRRIEGVLAEPSLQQLPSEPAPVESATEALEAARDASGRSAELEAVARERIAGRSGQLKRVGSELDRISDAASRLDRLRQLADAAQGKEPNTRRMRLEAFVLAARLEAIVDAANERLTRMVGGRYRLIHDDGLRSRGRQSGLGLAVLDEYTGRERSTDSLSGGETFLASLALALGLADVVTSESGGIRLDTLFIDEGFGTLDPDALDQALATLDALREGGRTVALISHVAELRERLPAQLEVLVDDRGISTLRGEGVIAQANAKRENP